MDGGVDFWRVVLVGVGAFVVGFLQAGKLASRLHAVLPVVM